MCLVKTVKLSGAAKARGVLLCPNVQQEFEYAWGLGEATNNQIEQWDLWMGLTLLKDSKHRKVVVVGDSMITIRRLRQLK